MRGFAVLLLIALISLVVGAAASGILYGVLLLFGATIDFGLSVIFAAALSAVVILSALLDDWIAAHG